MGDIDCCIGQLARMYGELPRMIEILVRIILWGIRGQEEHFDLLTVLFQPSRDEFSVMNLPIIQNKEYLLPGRANQTTHKLYEPLLIHGVWIEHKADAALVADSCNHINPHPLCLHRQHGRISLP